MIERGDGTFFLTQGFSAVMTAPHFSGPGPVMSAARNYLYSLNGELAGTGVYAGTLAVAAGIARSENAPAKPEGAATPGPLTVWHSRLLILMTSLSGTGKCS